MSSPPAKSGVPEPAHGACTPLELAQPEPTQPFSEREFVSWLKREGSARYHHRHAFNLRMHEGALQPHELKRWVSNRYYYQTRIPIKDALIVAKSEDPNFRRAWLRRIVDQDGRTQGEGGLSLWLGLAESVGLAASDVAACREVLPAVRRSADAYVEFVRQASLLEAVASSLTEAFAKDLMVERIAAWEKHYPWVDRRGLEYFRSRISRAHTDSEEALGYVLAWARSYREQALAVAALVRKTQILWEMLDGIDAACQHSERVPR